MDGWLARICIHDRGVPVSVDGFGFEVSMCGHEVDFGLLVVPAADVPTMDNGRLRPLSSRPGSGWNDIHSVVEGWVRNYDVGVAPYAFLEFDTKSGAHGLATPSMFLRASEIAQFPSLDGDGDVSSIIRERRTGLAFRLLDLLQRGPIGSASRSILEQMLAALPDGSVLLHIGIMFSRSNEIRVHVGVPSHAVEEYLDAISWPGSWETVARVLGRYASAESLTILQLELKELVSPGIGIEFSPGSGLGHGRSRGWSTLVERLVEDGLCDAATNDLLAAWPKVRRRRLSPEAWPCTIRQDISHVKITVRPDQPLRAKAYLSVVPSFSLFGAG